MARTGAEGGTTGTDRVWSAGRHGSSVPASGARGARHPRGDRRRGDPDGRRPRRRAHPLSSRGERRVLCHPEGAPRPLSSRGSAPSSVIPRERSDRGISTVAAATRRTGAAWHHRRPRFLAALGMTEAGALRSHARSSRADRRADPVGAGHAALGAGPRHDAVFPCVRTTDRARRTPSAVHAPHDRAERPSTRNCSLVRGGGGYGRTSIVARRTASPSGRSPSKAGRRAGSSSAVPADDDAVGAGRQVGRERDRVAVVQGRAGRPGGGRVAAVVRLGVALGDRAAVGADDVDEGLVGAAGRGVGAPEQVEAQRLAGAGRPGREREGGQAQRAAEAVGGRPGRRPAAGRRAAGRPGSGRAGPAARRGRRARTGRSGPGRPPRAAARPGSRRPARARPAAGSPRRPRRRAAARRARRRRRRGARRRCAARRPRGRGRAGRARRGARRPAGSGRGRAPARGGRGRGGRRRPRRSRAGGRSGRR